jgi:plastocyanin
MPGTARWVLILVVLCLPCGATGAVAVAATGHPARHHRSRGARACHRTKHHRCPATHAPKRQSKRHRTSKRARPKGGTGGSGPTSSWTNIPAAVGPGSTPAGPGGATGPTESPSTSAPARVQVTAEDSEAFRFVLSRPTVPAGRVIIEFVNHGQDEHNLNAIEPAEGSVAGSIPDTLPNAHPSLTVNLRRGSYTLFCSLPEHEAKGMKATLLVN